MQKGTLSDVREDKTSIEFRKTIDFCLVPANLPVQEKALALGALFLIVSFDCYSILDD